MRINKRGQVTLPKRIRDSLGLTPGTEVEVVATNEGLLVRRAKAGHPVDRVAGALDGLFEEDVDAFVDEIRGRSHTP